MGLLGRLFGRGNKNPISLVMLLSEKDTVVREKLRAMAAESKEGDEVRWASLGPFPAEDGSPGGEGFGLATPAGGMGIIICDHEYVPDVGVVAQSMPEHLGEPFRRHKAWIAVDWMGKKPKKFDPYVMIGPIAKLLIPETCILLYMPARSRASLPTPTLLEALESEDWISVFDDVGSDHTVQATADDDELERIAEQARASLPEFVMAYESGDGESFCVKAPFTDGKKTEHMWVRITEIADDGFVGELGNAPAIKGYREGQIVSVPIDDIEDWIFLRDGEMVGGESSKLLAARQGMM